MRTTTTVREADLDGRGRTLVGTRRRLGRIFGPTNANRKPHAKKSDKADNYMGYLRIIFSGLSA